MKSVNAYAALSATEQLKPFIIERREVTSDDVQIDILYCGVCHSDIHFVRNDWHVSLYPIVPGHEIVGKVTAVGTGVKKFKVGDLVGVGVMVDSCQKCPACAEGLEQYCNEGFTLTYSSPDKRHGGITDGGYSQQIIVREEFVLNVPTNLDTKAVAPLLCAGITTWSPLRHWKVGSGDVVGVIGLGGLGHMAIKFAHALGAKVVVITTSKDKGIEAKKLGADEVLVSTNAEDMAKYANHFDFLLNTIPVNHDLNPYVALLKHDKTMVIVGALEPLTKGVDGGALVFGRKSIAGSIIGGIKETQEMLDFCGKHNIVSDIELIDINYINEAFTRIIKADVKYRFVIDIASLK
jgi:uncharacterized zinc-type alcohol dehydrogenase-like protein